MMKKRIYDDEPTTQQCTGCGPKDEPCVCEPEQDIEYDPGPVQKITLEDRRRYMEELDHILCETLFSIVKSGKATPGHLKVACAYLKDKGFTLPEMAKRARLAEDKELLADIDLPFNA